VNQCLACPAGTYSTLDGTQCKTCPGGYLCYGQTNRENPTDYFLHHGEICPKGHYCPEGSSTATPCPIGTYQPSYGAKSIGQCLLCPANSFNDKTGQNGCSPCGFYAESEEGSTTCTCEGNYRSFSKVDSSCRCMSGYDFVDTSGISRGTESSSEDCTPLVYDRCEGTNMTRNADGKCVDIQNCTRACNGRPGIRSESLGICTCEDTVPVDAICNQNCRNNADKLVQTGATSVQLVDSEGNTVDVSLSEAGGTVVGEFTCSGCDIYSTEVAANGKF